MPLEITVTGADSSGVFAAQFGKQLPGAITRALNRAIAAARTSVKRALREDIGLAPKYGSRALRITRATWDTLEARLTASGRPLPLIAYVGTRGFRSGRGIAGRAYQTGTVGPGAFFAEVGTGAHRGIFRRVGRSRLPITEVFGQSIPRVIAAQRIFEAQQGVARETYARRLAHELDRLIQTKAAAGGDA